MAKSRNRLVAELLTSGVDVTDELVDRFEVTVTGESNTPIDTNTDATVVAVTYNIVAEKAGAYNYTTVAAVKNSSGSMDYTEYATIENDDVSLSDYSVELSGSNIILYADPTTTGVDFQSTRTVVEDKN